MIESGSTRKYLLYAIGEIALVVIGILIALQINNWNQQLNDHALEQKNLIDLRQELMTNRQKVEFQVERRATMKGPLDAYIKKLSEGDVVLDEFMEIHKEKFFSGRINPSFGVFNSIISSGEIKMIRNDSLKYLITEWQDYMGNYVEVEHTIFDGHRAFQDYFIKKFPGEGNQIHRWSSIKLANAFKEVVEDVEYINRLLRVQDHLEVGVRIGNNNVEYIDEMINLIDSEISKQ